MFTGIIEGTGRIKGLQQKEDGCAIAVEVDFDLEQSNIGESIAVNGVCLTMTSRLGNTFWADLSEETCSLTTLGELQDGDPVNLERPLKMGERMGGHWVQGHVDGIGIVHDVETKKGGTCVAIRVPVSLKRYLVAKGSIAMDGVSLTINRVAEDIFELMLIPQTLLKTTFQGIKRGNKVNLEVDILGKYVEKLTHLDAEAYALGGTVTSAFLKKHGFKK